LLKIFSVGYDYYDSLFSSSYCYYYVAVANIYLQYSRTSLLLIVRESEVPSQTQTLKFVMQGRRPYIMRTKTCRHVQNNFKWQ